MSGESKKLEWLRHLEQRTEHLVGASYEVLPSGGIPAGIPSAPTYVLRRAQTDNEFYEDVFRGLLGDKACDLTPERIHQINAALKRLERRD